VIKVHRPLTQSHEQYNNDYKNVQAKDEQVYNANYKTTQDISIVQINSH